MPVCCLTRKFDPIIMEHQRISVLIVVEPARLMTLKGTVDEMRAQTEGQVDEILRSDAENIAIFELSEIANTQATL